MRGGVHRGELHWTEGYFRVCADMGDRPIGGGESLVARPFGREGVDRWSRPSAGCSGPRPARRRSGKLRKITGIANSEGWEHGFLPRFLSEWKTRLQHRMGILCLSSFRTCFFLPLK